MSWSIEFEGQRKVVCFHDETGVYPLTLSSTINSNCWFYCS